MFEYFGVIMLSPMNLNMWWIEESLFFSLFFFIEPPSTFTYALIATSKSLKFFFLISVQ